MFEFGIWTVVTLIVLGLCTWLPIRIQDDTRRRLAYWLILIPASLVLIAYVYPAGIEFCRRWAVSG